MRVETDEIVACPGCGELTKAVYIQRATLFAATQTSELLPCITCVAAMSCGFRVGNKFREYAMAYNAEYITLPHGCVFDPSALEVHKWYGEEDCEYIEFIDLPDDTRKVIAHYTCPD